MPIEHHLRARSRTGGHRCILRAKHQVALSRIRRIKHDPGVHDHGVDLSAHPLSECNQPVSRRSGIEFEHHQISASQPAGIPLEWLDADLLNGSWRMAAERRLFHSAAQNPRGLLRP